MKIDICLREVPGSYLGRFISFSDRVWWVASVSVCECWDGNHLSNPYLFTLHDSLSVSFDTV